MKYIIIISNCKYIIFVYYNYIMDLYYQQKYLKYKLKYKELKN